jgi:hypothetical protein
MRRITFALLLCLPVLATAAGQAPEGRWEGSVTIPGRELPIVVDLAPDSKGAWAGSITIPGLNIQGAQLAKIGSQGGELSFEIAALLETPGHGPALFDARLDSSGAMKGEMHQGGNVAPFSLRRTGPAQVDMALRSTPVGKPLEDRWVGEFELNGYPRHVTMTLENHADAAATATLVIVGKQTTNVPVSLVVEEGRFLRVESQATRFTFEGRLEPEKDEIKGVFELGAFELPVVLRRAPRSPS